MEKVVITKADLRDLVISLVSAKISLGKYFSASDIVTQIEAAYPNIQIDSIAVRMFVHAYMSKQPSYQFEVSKDALIYSQKIQGLTIQQQHPMLPAQAKPSIIQNMKKFLTIHWGK